MCVDYFRQLIIHSTIPNPSTHLIMFAMAAVCAFLGWFTYHIARDKIALYV